MIQRIFRDDSMSRTNVAVCICTYRRALQLDRLLSALADQSWTQLPQPAITAVVVENELDGPGKEVCDKHAVQGKLDIRYSSEPRPGVPIARNRCLDMATDCSDFIAFIDDDELPAPDWLEQLLLLQFSTGADVVAGPVLASYAISPPAWLVRGGFHDSGPAGPIGLSAGSRASLLKRLLGIVVPPAPDGAPMASGTPVRWFNTGNVLLRTNIIRRMELRFDESLRHFGYGADTLFSRRIANAGYRMVWSNDAVVHHLVPPSRMSAGWLVRRAMQQGYCAVLVDRRLNEGVASGMRNLLFGLVSIALNILALPVAVFAGRHRTIWHLLPVARHLGRFAGGLGLTLRYDRRGQTQTAGGSEAVQHRLRNLG